MSVVIEMCQVTPSDYKSLYLCRLTVVSNVLNPEDKSMRQPRTAMSQHQECEPRAMIPISARQPECPALDYDHDTVSGKEKQRRHADSESIVRRCSAGRFLGCEFGDML